MSNDLFDHFLVDHHSACSALVKHCNTLELYNSYVDKWITCYLEWHTKSSKEYYWIPQWIYNMMIEY